MTDHTGKDEKDPRQEQQRAREKVAPPTKDKSRDTQEDKPDDKAGVTEDGRDD